MRARKSAEARLKEGRGRGVGANYQPFIKVEEARSKASATRLYDEQQGRSVHTLSQTELCFYLTSKYYFAKSGNPILFVKEQYRLDMEDVNRIRREMGLPATSLKYTTDFVYQLRDGQKRAYSIKASTDEFRHTKTGKLKETELKKLEVRQEIERRYWHERGTPFSIVAGDILNSTLASNLRTLHYHSDDRFIVTTGQKALWLAANGFIEIKNIETERINAVKLCESLEIDVDDYYDYIMEVKEGIMHGKRN